MYDYLVVGSGLYGGGVAPLLFALIVAVLGIALGYKFINHELRQNQALTKLQAEVSLLSAKVNNINSQNIKWPDGQFKYLAIGNSLTLHAKTSFWWNENGMAASDKNHDYFHLVVDYLNTNNGPVYAVPTNFAAWEVQTHDRDETLMFLEPYLNKEIDLITIQVAENAHDISTFEKDFISLINFVKDKCPKARVLVVGDFWKYSNRDEQKERACKKAGAEYVSLHGIKDNKEYFCGIGTRVLGDDGKEHIVEHDGVAAHPGDKGMKAIAERIIEQLKKDHL